MSHIALPVVIDDLHPVRASVEPTSQRAHQKNPATAKFRFADGIAGKKGTPVNPWQLRDRFLSWPLEDWQRFFEISGRWDVGVSHRGFSRDDFAEWQRLLHAALIYPAKDWDTILDREFELQKVFLLKDPIPIILEWNGKVPVARIPSRNALRSMIASIQLDKLQGAEFRVCARQDCNNPPFRVGVRHKIFCSTDCAHLVAVRNSRNRVAKRAGRK